MTYLGKGLALVVLAAILCSCGGGDDGVSFPDFVGTWKLGGDVAGSGLPEQITFNADHTYIAVYGANEVVTGSVEVVGGIVTVPSSRGEMVCTLSQGAVTVSTTAQNQTSTRSFSQQQNATSLVGRWVLVYASHLAIDGYDSPSLLAFYPDGRLYGEMVRGRWSNEQGEETGTYTTSGNRMWIEVQDNNGSVTFTIANNVLTLEQPADDPDDGHGAIYRMVFVCTSIVP